MKTQSEVLARLEAETRKEARRIEDYHNQSCLVAWSAAKKSIRASVLTNYHQDYRGETWHTYTERHHNTIGRILNETMQHINFFIQQFKFSAKHGLLDIHNNEVLRGLWMLDQTTPASRRVNYPAYRGGRKRESASPRDYSTSWEDSVTEWMRAWQLQFEANLRLEALHSGSMSDAADEVDATKIGGSDPERKLSQLFETEAILAQQYAREDVVDANDDLVANEVWQTLEDDSVCPECDELDGQDIEEIGESPPLHPGPCRCFTRIVPKAWAELLRSGDAEDKAVALEMDDAGFVPTTMAVRGADGGLVGTATVRFDEWVGSQPFSLGGLNVSGGMK